MDFDNLEFSLRYTISDEMQRTQIRYSIYDGLDCQEGSNELFVLGYPYLESKMALSPSRQQRNHNDATVYVKINQQEISESPVFQEYINEGSNSTDAIIAFCVRLGLFTETETGAAEQEAVEVNFLETPLELDVTLHDGLYIHLDGEIINRQLFDDKVNDISGEQDHSSLRGSSTKKD